MMDFFYVITKTLTVSIYETPSKGCPTVNYTVSMTVTFIESHHWRR